jgi:hypothetical protein
MNLKSNWSEKDYEQMGWHDTKIYAIYFDDENFRLLFDIDYLMEWIPEEGSSKYFQFLISPSTLIFRNVWDVNINLDYALDIVIEDVKMGNPTQAKNISSIVDTIEYDWDIITSNGSISFKSTGFNQIAKIEPIISKSQRIGLLPKRWS